MNTEQRVYADFQRLVSTYPGLFKGLVSVVEDINRIGSIKQAQDEAQAAVDAAKAEKSSVLSSIATDKAVAEAELKAVLDKIESHKDQHTQLIADSATQSNGILANASAQAKKITDAANDTARKAILAAETSVASVQERLRALDTQIAAKKAELETVSAELDARTSQHSKVIQDIAALKSRLA